MVGWHHRLNGHEFEQAPGVGDGQGSLACCSPWGPKSRTQLSDWAVDWSLRNGKTAHLCHTLPAGYQSRTASTSMIHCLTPWIAVPLSLEVSSNFLVAQTAKNLPAMQEARVWHLGREDALEKGMQPTPVFFLPGKSHGQRSLVGYSPRGHKELDTAKQHLTLLRPSAGRGRHCPSSL